MDDDEQRDGPRWWQRTLPLVGVVAVVLVAASLLSSGVREQVGLSVTRKPTSYVELYFATADGDLGGATAACTRTRRVTAYTFAVVSHLQERRDVAYVVTARPLRRGAFKARRSTGTLATRPGATATQGGRLVLPRRAGYLLSVSLPDLDQTVRARCRPAGR